MAFDPRQMLRDRDAEDAAAVPLGGTREQAVQRLQIGLFGIVAMLMLIGLADIVITRAQITEEATVPDAAPTVEPSETAAPRDPLSDVGVVPDVPTEQTDQVEPAAGPQPTEDVPPANAQLQ